MTIEVYYSPSQNSYTTGLAGFSFANSKSHLEPDAKLILTISGKDWTDCMTKYHKEMGWEPYIPMENESIDTKFK